VAGWRNRLCAIGATARVLMSLSVAHALLIAVCRSQRETAARISAALEVTMRVPGCHWFAFGLAVALVAGCTVTGSDEEDLDTSEAQCWFWEDCRAQNGEWSGVQNLPIYPIHGFVLPNGKVMLLQGSGGRNLGLGAAIWDPADGSARVIPSPTDDLFCSGHTWLADGRLLIAGGHPIGAGFFSYIFDPATESFRRVGDLHYARWYPTLVRMADGRVFATGGNQVGASGVGQDIPEMAEIFDPATEQWTVVDGSARNVSETYPGLHLMPDGRIYYTSGVGWAPSLARPAYFTLTGATSGFWTEASAMQIPDRQDGATILGTDAGGSTRVYVVGGGLPDDVVGDWQHHRPGPHALQAVEVLDASAITQQPGWQRLSDMHHERTNVNAIFLADGTIFAVGGARGFKYNDPARLEPVYQAEIFEPSTNSWSTVGSMEVDRTYHSIAMLLPDGRVLVGGGEINPQAALHYSLEVFSPPYLFKGDRPIIEDIGDGRVGYGGQFFIQVDRPGDIAEVRLVSPAAITHHTDTGRAIDLPIVGRGDYWLSVGGPASGDVAPPGWYMLFAVDVAGVPSVGRYVYVGG
jgi:hypothetical protein